MKNLIWLALVAPLMACDPATAPVSEDDRGPIGKADLVGSCEDACGGPSDGNCWCDASCPEYGDCCEDVHDFCAGCLDGFEFAETESGCLQDAACYALEGGGFCTGGCPAGEVLDLDDEPACVPDPMPCPTGFEIVETEADCLQDVGCFDTGAGWCTGACPAGQGLQIDETGAACVPVDPTCIEGFELVETDADCLQDAVCYASGDMFCTGDCPQGSVFMNIETGPACVPQ